MNSMTEQFFDALSSRFGNENDLSDITWSMVQASPVFKKEWIHFFFRELCVEQIGSIEREVTDYKGMGSRADFVIYTFSRECYVIEVKKGDRSHHFGQYDKAYGIPKDHLGYITNYPHKEAGYEVKEWKEFHNHLKSLLNTIADNEERVLIEGYCTYLETTCCIMTVKNIIDIEKTSSLYDLIKAFKSIIEKSTDHFQTHFWKDFTDDKSKSIYFGIRYYELYPTQEFFPYIGIWYDLPEGPRISAGFWRDKGWGREICEMIEKHYKPGEDYGLKYCDKPHIERYYTHFYLSQTAKDRFNNATDVSEQVDILNNYLEEVLTFPLKLSML